MKRCDHPYARMGKVWIILPIAYHFNGFAVHLGRIPVGIYHMGVLCQSVDIDIGIIAIQNPLQFRVLDAFRKDMSGSIFTILKDTNAIKPTDF